MERFTVQDPEWYEQANCATTDPEVMFPKKGGSLKLARKICAECVVVPDCLNASIIEDDVRTGFRGGKTPKERRAYAKTQTSDGGAGES